MFIALSKDAAMRNTFMYSFTYALCCGSRHSASNTQAKKDTNISRKNVDGPHCM